MVSLNRCEFIGHVGREPEVRTMNDGSTVINLSIGCTEKWRDKNTGEQKERTEWVKIVVFNEGLCKVIQQYVKKGDLIRAVGQMQTRKWTDQQGNDKYTTEIVLQRYSGELTMLGGTERPQSQGYSENHPGAHGGTQKQGVADLDSEIPF